MVSNIENAIVRIWDGKLGVVGGGVLVQQDQVLTCAHVLPDSDLQDIFIDFPLVDSRKKLKARIIERLEGHDLALVKVIDVLPENTRPLEFERNRPVASHSFSVYGFPDGRDGGGWSFGKILRKNSKGYYQIEADTSYSPEQGYSGSLVWDETSSVVMGILSETDRDVARTKTAYVIPVNLILSVFPHLETVLEENKDRIQYACYISYPNDFGAQGNRVRDFARKLANALECDIKSLLDYPVFFDSEHLDLSDDMEKALCESVCLIVILTPKYFRHTSPLCAMEFKAMEQLEKKRFEKLSRRFDNISFIIPVLPYSRDILPMTSIGTRKNYDFRDMTVTEDPSTHPKYARLIREIAEHIYRCYSVLENGIDQSNWEKCSNFSFPVLDKHDKLFSHIHHHFGFPGRHK